MNCIATSATGMYVYIYIGYKYLIPYTCHQDVYVSKDVTIRGYF